MCSSWNEKRYFPFLVSKEYSVCSDVSSVPVCHGEGAKSKGKALDLLADLGSQTHPWAVTERTIS